MVRRSLVFKSYVYASVVFFASLPLSFAVGQMLMEQGRRDSMKGFLAPQLLFIEHEVERDWKPGAREPDRADLAEMGRALRHHIRFVPWAELGGYPASLNSQKVVIDLRPRDQKPVHWVRVEREGRPVGALAVSPEGGPGGMRGPGGPPPGAPHRPPGPFGPSPVVAAVWALVLLLIIVPPLWFWVIRPLKSMAAVAQRLGGGDLETPVAIDRKDEFGELERAFERMRVQLRESMEQKERLLYDVSHEVRGPLSRMVLALPLLRQQGAAGPILEIMERELHTADALLQDVLSLARGQRPAVLRMAPTDLAAIARRLVEERGVVFEQKDQHITLEAAPAAVVGDDGMLARAMGNLLDNALKYTPEGGHLRVTTRREGDVAIYTVEDDGPGIGPEHLPHIFEPFYRPDDSRSRETGGTGLGLSIVRGAVESHGGTVSLHSTPGVGTTAVIELPAAEAPAAAASA